MGGEATKALLRTSTVHLPIQVHMIPLIRPGNASFCRMPKTLCLCHVLIQLQLSIYLREVLEERLEQFNEVFGVLKAFHRMLAIAKSERYLLDLPWFHRSHECCASPTEVCRYLQL